MKKRIFKNWRTSLLGASLLICAIIALFLKLATWQEFVAFIPFCMGLIYVKDTILGFKE